jgi:ankyrin repeat protein
MAFDKACEGVQNGDLPIDEISRSLAIEKGEDDVTLLHWAAYNNRCRIARRLIECGADVNVSGGKVGETPLMWAMRRKFYAMGALLVENGADVHAVSKSGCDLVHNCVKMRTDTEGDLLGLFLALQWGANTDHRDDKGDTALSWLAANRIGDQAHDLMRLLMRYHDEDKEAMSYHKQQEARGDANSLLHLLAEKSMLNVDYKPRYTDLNIAMDIHQHPEIASWSSQTAPTRINSSGMSPWELASTHKHSYLNFLLIDAVQYNLAPKWVPGASLRLAWCFSLRFCFRTLDCYGVLYFFPLTVPALSKFTLQWNITEQNFVSYAGLVIGFFLLMIILIHSYAPSFTSYTLFWAMIVCTAAISVRLANTPPLTLPAGDREALVKGIVAGSLQEGPRMVDEEGNGLGGEGRGAGSSEAYAGPLLCPTCICDKRFATNHCNLCGRCVCGQDAHIPHLGVCAGQGNRRLFVLMLASMCATFLVFTLVAFSFHAEVMCPDTDYWFVFNWVAVEVCVLLQDPSQCGALLIAFAVTCYTFVILYTDLLFVGKELTLNLAANHLVTSLPNISAEAVTRNIKKFFREGSYGISLGDIRVEYAPPVRRKKEAKDIEVPWWLRYVSLRLGFAANNVVCKTYTLAAAFVGEYSGAKYVPPLHDLDSEAAEFDDEYGAPRTDTGRPRGTALDPEQRGERG